MRSYGWTLALALAVVAGGFETRQATPDVFHKVGSFKVTIEGLWSVNAAGERAPLSVVSSCLEAHGGSIDDVPQDIRGTDVCRYAIPGGSVEIELSAITLDRMGQPLNDFNREVSLRIVPGDLDTSPTFRTMTIANGVGTAVLRASHLFGTTHVWVEDVAPAVTPGVEGGEVVGRDEPDAGMDRTLATGVSRPLLFQEPTLATVQVPDGADNRSSPLTGRFVTIGRAPEGGEIIRQNCEDPSDPAHGLPMTLVVTGADNSGFYVTDLTACRAPEHVRFNGLKYELYSPLNGQSTNGITPEPARTVTLPPACQARTGLPSTRVYGEHVNPGTFGSIYVYNYNYPEGLYPGDLLWTIAGSVQEFTSSTQLTFPSWTVRQSTRILPVERWNENLECVPVPDLNLRTCGVENANSTWITDVICGQNTRNLKLESMESALVRVRGIRLPTHFEHCDTNGDNSVVNFCDSSSGGGRIWTHCDFDHPTLKPDFERACYIACHTMQPTVGEEPFLENVPRQSRTYDFNGAVCTEKSTYDGFGQFVVEMAGPGTAEGGLDPSLTERYESLTLGSTPAVNARVFRAGQDAVVWCSQEVRYRFGTGQAPAEGDAVLPARQILHHRMAAGALTFSVLPTGEVQPGAYCTIGQNPRTRINLITREAVPDLEPNCDPNSADADAAAQCRALRAATFDVVGHLRHIQPARPRWAIIPRDADDLCCNPGPGLECPRPIKTCQ